MRLGVEQMIKIAFCDDKLKDVQTLVKIVESITISNNLNIEILKVTANQSEIYDLIEKNLIDVLFLDIDFKDSESNGLFFAEKLRKVNKSFYLIFCTGHFEYAMLSFKYKTFDYILKPINLDVLTDLVLRINSEFQSYTNKENKFVRFKNNVIIKCDDIIFIEKDGYKANIYTEDNCYSTNGTISDLLEVLPNYFIRCHRSYIANIKHVLSLDHQINKLNFKENLVCPVTDKYISKFYEMRGL